ncbi:MAG: hypothetical protein Q4G11_07070, partial [Gallicola sp.]|nr:hypothetical protein [Gallicola sp.]
MKRFIALTLIVVLLMTGMPPVYAYSEPETPVVEATQPDIEVLAISSEEAKSDPVMVAPEEEPAVVP